MDKSLDLITLSDLFGSPVNQPDIFLTIYSFLLCTIMAFLIREVYLRKSITLSGKTQIASIIPTLSLVVFLVILVVNSSLALSLGLVGALSIVRFRTPIKEPEELVYLFLSIGIGLGYASGQIMITTIVSILILLIISFKLSNKKIAKNYEYNLVVNWPQQKLKFVDIKSIISKYSVEIKLIRLDSTSDLNTAVFLISGQNVGDIDNISSDIKNKDKDSQTSFYEAKLNW